MKYIGSSAVFSGCEGYRYYLSRTWDVLGPRVLYIMLNPSRAGTKSDDPTVRWLASYSERNNYCGLGIVNLFAAVEPVPAVMFRMRDPVGPACDEYILNAVESGLFTRFVAAWGNGGLEEIAKPRVEFVVDVVTKQMKQPLYCIGRTKGGAPMHPLRKSHGLELTIYEEAA